MTNMTNMTNMTAALTPGGKLRPAVTHGDRLGAQTAGSSRQTPFHSGCGEPEVIKLSGVTATFEPQGQRWGRPQGDHPKPIKRVTCLPPWGLRVSV